MWTWLSQAMRGFVLLLRGSEPVPPAPPEESRPKEAYRRGRYFVTRLGLWWLVCRDTDDPTNPDVFGEFALLSRAIAEVQELAKVDSERVGQ